MCWLKSPKVDQLPNLILIPNLYQEKTCCNSDQTLFDTTALFKYILVCCYKNSFHNVNRILISMSNYSFEYKFTNYISTLDYQSSKLRLYIQSSRCLKDPKTEVQCQWMCFLHMCCRDAHQAYLWVIEKMFRDLENDLHRFQFEATEVLEWIILVSKI